MIWLIKLIVVWLIKINSGLVNQEIIRLFFFGKLTVHYRVQKIPHRTVSTTYESSPHASTVRHAIHFIIILRLHTGSFYSGFTTKITHVFRKACQCYSSLSFCTSIKNTALEYLSVNTLNTSDRSDALSNSHWSILNSLAGNVKEREKHTIYCLFQSISFWGARWRSD